MIYETPYLMPYPEMFQRYSFYGDTEQVPTSSTDYVDPQTLALIEEYAPPLARLIASESSEETLETLKVRLQFLEQYQNLPILKKVIGLKIAETKARIDVLEKKAKADQFRRTMTYHGYGFGTLAIIGLTYKSFKK